MSGPFATEQEAAQWAEYMVGPRPWTDSAALGNRDLLACVIKAAGLELGAYDRVILDFHAEWETATVAVLAGLIARAHMTGLTPATAGTLIQALTDAMDFRAGKTAACADCDAAELAGASGGVCDRHRDDFDRGTRYLELSVLLGARTEVIR